MSSYWIIILLFTISLNSDQYFKYCQRSIKLKRITRGYYKNVLTYEEASLLTSRAQNSILETPFKNQIYISGQINLGTYFAIGHSMIIELRQVFELNTLLLMLRNGNVRTYDFIVYASDSNQEIVIFDSITYYIQVVQIKFPNQYVKYFRIYNRNSTPNMNIIKAEAYFSF